MGSLYKSTIRKPIEKHQIKKSQGFEAWFFVMAIILATAIFFLILNKAWGSIKDPLRDGLTSSTPEDANANITKILDQTSGVSSLFDKLFPFLIIGLFGFLMIMAGGIMKNGVMIFVGIIIMGVIITLAVIYANVYNSISSTDEFADSKSQLTIQDKFMQYLPFIVFFGGVGVVIGVLWARGSTSGNTGL